MSGVVELFRSGSEGIVAARKLDGNSGTLAVADSHVVVLHDIHKGMQRSYRLKGSEVCLYACQALSKRIGADRIRDKFGFSDMLAILRRTSSLPPLCRILYNPSR